MPRYFLFAVLVYCALFAAGCPEDLDAPPAYVVLEGFDVQTPGIDGTTSAISEVWVFAGREYIGAFPLPARIPVYRAGETTIRFQPGVRRNGISVQPDLYEFYASPERTLDLVPGQTIDVGVLETGYRQDVKFGFIEGFEPGTSRVFTENFQGEAVLEVTEEMVRSGQRAGRLMLDEEDILVAFSSESVINDVFAQRPYVWLELDFKSNVPVVWGVSGIDQMGQTRREFDPTTARRDEWTKIYFDLTGVISRLNVKDIKVVFTAGIPEGEAEAEVFLDNIRLLHF